jgi:hypothetical protein
MSYVFFVVVLKTCHIVSKIVKNCVQGLFGIDCQVPFICMGVLLISIISKPYDIALVWRSVFCLTVRVTGGIT